MPHDHRAILTADQLHTYIYLRIVRGRPRGACARTIAGSHELPDALLKLLCQHECSSILIATCHIVAFADPFSLVIVLSLLLFPGSLAT